MVEVSFSFSANIYFSFIYILAYFMFVQNVKAYFRRGTAREVLGYYKEAIEGQIGFFI